MDAEETNALISIIGSTRAHIEAALSAVNNGSAASARNHLLIVKRHVEDALNKLGSD